MSKPVLALLIAIVIVFSGFALAFVNYDPSIGSEAGYTYNPNLGMAYVGNVVISSNGAVSVPGIFSQNGNTYTLLQNVNGTIYDQKNASLINGNGFLVDGLTADAFVSNFTSDIGIKNLNVNNSSNGIDLLNVNNVLITNLTFVTTQTDVMILGSKNVTISSSTMNASKYGVDAESSYIISTIGNSFTSSASSTFFYSMYVNGVVIANNSVKFYGSATNSAGIELYFGSSYATITNNTISGASNGILSFLSEDEFVSYNRVSNLTGAGVAFTFALVSNFILYRDTSSGTMSNPLLLEASSNAVIHDCTFNNSGNGSEIVTSSNITILHSDFSNVSSSGVALNLTTDQNMNVSYDVFNETVTASNYALVIESSQSVAMYRDTVFNQMSAGIDLENTTGFSLKSSLINATAGVVSQSQSSETSFINDTFLLSPNGEGIYFVGSVHTDFLLEGSTFLSDLNQIVSGVEFTGSRLYNFTITNNVFSLTGYGVFILAISTGSAVPGYVSNVQVSDNQFYNTSVPILVAPAINTLISGNTIVNYTDTGYGGFMSAPTAISVFYSNNASLVNNTLLNYTQLGFLIYGSYGTPSEIAYNTIEGAGLGGQIYAFMTVQTSIFDNRMNNTGGIYLEENGQPSVFNNVITNSSVGISSYGNSNFSYFNNFIENSSTGSLYSQGDYSGQIFGNTFAYTNGSLLVLDGSNDISLFHNNFINTTGAPVTAIGNAGIQWNQSLPVGGNYWSNYTGSGSNGIGSKPYNISAGNTDYLPLTSKWTAYSVTFVETGLPIGTQWSATLDGSTLSAVGSTIVFYPDAAQPVSESYSIAKVAGYTLSSSSGSISLNSQNEIVNITYLPYTYGITFTESGLASGTSWSITIGTNTVSSTTSTMTIQEPNGTYNYTVNSVSGYTTSIASGTVEVNAGTASVSVSFSAESYDIVVSETGLPSGTAWNVYLNGKEYNTTASNMTISVVPGSYYVLSVPPSGYSVSLQTTSINANSNMVLNLTFSKTKTGFSTVSLLGGIGIGAAIGIIAVILGSYFVTGSMPFVRSGVKKP